MSQSSLLRLQVDQATGPSAALTALIEGCANPGVTRQVLMVRVAQLPPDLGRPQHVRLIKAAMDPLRNLDRGCLFHLADDTLVVVWRGAAESTLAQAMSALDRLFADLPVFPVSVLDLPRDAARLTSVVEQSVPGGRPQHAPSGHRLAPPGVAALELALNRANLANFVHRRSVCHWVGEGTRHLAWERRRVSVKDLSATLAPGVNVRADRWLYQRLTRSFDRCMLALLSDPEELRGAGPFALDLNVTSILSPDFIKFDAALPRRLRGEVVLCVLPADVLADASSFALARDFARTRGYRLMLRKVTQGWLRVFPPELLGVDMIELNASALTGGSLPILKSRCVVLSQVAEERQIAWGLGEGIEYFEGPIVRPDPQTLPSLNLRRSRR